MKFPLMDPKRKFIEKDNLNDEDNPATETETTMEKPVVHVDHREAKSGVVRELSNLGVQIRTSTLTVADYQISDNIGVERKSAHDFTGSIIDKRLYKQAKDLVDQFSSPIIIIEGESIYSGGLHPNAVRGALASLAVDFKIPILPTRSPEDTAAMIYRLAIRELKKGPRDMPLLTEKKTLKPPGTKNIHHRITPQRWASYCP